MLSKNVLATLSLALASGVMANPPHGQPACCSNSKGICASGRLPPARSILQRDETQLTIWPWYSLVHYYSGPTGPSRANEGNVPGGGATAIFSARVLLSLCWVPVLHSLPGA
ncbi:uncharacterized protein FOBCDRAFT_208880 [Fusarium oxysporum Fo47]|uniref:uncharacterized protein n=1 Tax=Fusarium oxysporum Fo47 TaxID=660027 RepID=UPI002869A4DE|nr:uncharacterized protein FOBCDRAFT_208880 [Fusarium oxysporum Fo47]WJG37200.1 hypothetical protein FOBCDRAFT_208880 [Fusarium oxysporum Fo47]